MSYNNVMKILFLNNFSLMNSIKEELILQIMWTTAFFLVSSMLNIEKKKKKNQSMAILISGHCILDGLYKHYLGVWQVGQGSHIAYLLGKVWFLHKERKEIEFLLNSWFPQFIQDKTYDTGSALSLHFVVLGILYVTVHINRTLSKKTLKNPHSTVGMNYFLQIMIFGFFLVYFYNIIFFSG